MLAPISWLKDYVEINVSPEILAKNLVSVGFEVEEIIYQEKQVSSVVVGKIVNVERHPNADRLRVTKIDIGEKTIQVVTNVDVKGGEIIAVSLDGACLAGGLLIKKGELRGVMSEGMLCGLEELGLTTDDVQGQVKGDIIRFDENAVLGENALKALGWDDIILDVGVTANRPDCNSIYKLAKEVAVALKTYCKEPEIDYSTIGGNVNDVVKVTVSDTELCPRYMAGAVKNIKIMPSSQKIKSRLRAVGIRPINNIVDITNYVLIEIGQPMHAFDKRDLKSNQIVVRRAENDEKIVTLDGKENTLNNSMLVISDEKRAVAIAGVMGGENSGVKEDTSEIIFEAAKFARDNIRRTSRSINLRSDSSSRFEKGIDFASQEYGLKRALTLIYQSKCGDIVDDLIDVCAPYEKSRQLEFTTKKLKEILGCTVKKDALITILTRLGIEIEDKGSVLVAKIPEDREDITNVNDIAEEFIRVYGFNHIKPTLFKYAQFIKGERPPKMVFVDKIKNTLSAVGLNESLSYSFVPSKFSDMLNLPSDDIARQAIPLLNPLSDAVSVMRTTLTHSMLDSLTYNATHFNKEAGLFEVAKVYLPKELPLKELPYEEERLSIGLYGEDCNFFTIKGYVEALLSALNLKAEYTRSSSSYLHPGRCADIIVNNVNVGNFGEVHPDVLDNYGLNVKVYIAEISIDKLFGQIKSVKKFSAFSKFPIIERDLAVVVSEEISAGELKSAVEKAKINFLTDVEIFDTYKGEQIGAGKVSIALSFSFSSLERTLKDEEINDEMTRILNVLKRKFKAKIR